MIDVEVSGVVALEGYFATLAARFSDYRGFFNDFAAGLLSDRVRDVFETEGFGTWTPLSPGYARAKAVAAPGRGILQRSGAYVSAATSLDDPGNVYLSTETALVYGVDGRYFASGSGENYPERHEFGLGVPERPVFELLAEDSGFDAEVGALLERWSDAEIAEVERIFA